MATGAVPVARHILVRYEDERAEDADYLEGLEVGLRVAGAAIHEERPFFMEGIFEAGGCLVIVHLQPGKVVAHVPDVEPSLRVIHEVGEVAHKGEAGGIVGHVDAPGVPVPVFAVVVGEGGKVLSVRA